MEIKINVTDLHPVPLGAPVIICGNRGYTIAFEFDEQWDNAGMKTARFVWVEAGKVKHQDVAFMSEPVRVPILSNVREVRVGVFANNLQTTTPAVIPCELSILCGSGEVEAEPITPSQYDEVMALLNAEGVAYLAATKQNKLAWLATEDIQAMWDGEYEDTDEPVEPDDDPPLSVELQPLQIEQTLIAGYMHLGNYDGTEPMTVPLPIGFEYRQQRYEWDGDRPLWDLDGPTVLDGNFRPVPDAEPLTFDRAYAFPSQDADGYKILFIWDTIKNEKHRITFTQDYLDYTLETAPLVGESGGTTELQPLHFTGAVDVTYDGTEPVGIPIPSGGGGYRLIRKIVVDESNQAHAYSVSTDEDGSPFELKHLYIMAKIGASATRSDGYLNLNNSGQFVSPLSIEYKEQYAYFQADIKGEEIVFMQRYTQEPSASSASSKGMYMRPLSHGKITSILMKTSGTTHLYPIGSTFEIYGY